MVNDDDWKLPPLSTKAWLKLLTIVVMILIVGVIYLGYQLRGVNASIEDLNNNFPQSACGASVDSDSLDGGSSTINCH